MIIEYGRANENYRQCARQYALQYPDRQCPNHTTIMKLINRACEDKLCCKCKKKFLTDANDLNTAVLGIVVINPQIGQRTISLDLNVSQSTIRQILKANFHVYHIQTSSGTN